MIERELLASKFEAGLPYEAYVATAKPEHLENWRGFEPRAALTEAQRALVASFTRGINCLAVSGTWCGDCVQQLPFLAHIERANPEVVRCRFLDRDEHRWMRAYLTDAEVEPGERMRRLYRAAVRKLEIEASHLRALGEEDPE